MKRPVAYGIDFGTTNSSIAAYKSGKSIVVHAEADADPVGTLRSLIFLHRDGDRAAGRDVARRYLMVAPVTHSCGRCDRVQFDREGAYSACKQFRLGGRCHDARMMSQLKPTLTDRRFCGTSSWAEFFEPEDLAAVILLALKRAADREFKADVNRAMLGYPVQFGDSSDGQLALERLRVAALRAGFDEIEFCAEPVAAVVPESPAFPGKTICSVDFGGGTFDVAVVKFPLSADEAPEILATGGILIGGELFDSMLFEAFVEPHLGVDANICMQDGSQRQLSPRIRRELRSLAGVSRLAADDQVLYTFDDFRHRVQDPNALKVLHDLLYGGQAFAFWSEIEAAKKTLSKKERGRLRFRRGEIDIDISIARAELESLIAPELQRVRDCITDTVTAAGAEPRQLDAVLRTGGSSLIPAFNVMLDEVFGATRVESRPAFSSVVGGLAEQAYNRWT